MPRGRPKLNKEEDSILTKDTSQSQTDQASVDPVQTNEHAQSLEILDKAILMLDKVNKSLKSGDIHFTIGKDRESYLRRIIPNVKQILDIQKQISIVINDLSK